MRLEDADAAWLGSLTDKFYSKLVKAGLAEPRIENIDHEPEQVVVTLGELLTDHARDGRTAKGRPAAEKTRIKWRASITYLQDFFDYDRDINTITHDGLRKMEVFRSTWADVLWSEGRMRIYATKTAHHEGREFRYVPLRDIRPYLDALYFGPATVDGPIITRFTPSNSNLDKPFKAILHRAGLTPWPKLFQNMHASCETEWLDEGIPAHVVAAWIGHSVQVQRQSYAQITDGHFEKFNTSKPIAEPIVCSDSICGSDVASYDENSREKVSHQPVKRRKPQKTLGFPGLPVAVEGLE